MLNFLIRQMKILSRSILKDDESAKKLGVRPLGNETFRICLPETLWLITLEISYADGIGEV
jgi:hypothetical protein